MDLVSRLKQYLDARQISVTQFADECSIPRPTGSQLLAGRNKKVSDEIIGKIHIAYPDLSIVWLMFGEGDMTTDKNIKISEPQNNGIFDHNTTQLNDAQEFTSATQVVNSHHQNDSEKISESSDSGFNYNDDISISSPDYSAAESTFSNTFSFTPNSEPTIEVNHPTDTTHSEETTDSKSPSTDDDKDTITLTPGKGKRVTGIVVYYDDNTYESFIPDPSRSHPFMP